MNMVRGLVKNTVMPMRYSMIKMKGMAMDLASRSLRMVVSATTTVGTLPRCTVNTCVKDGYVASIRNQYTCLPFHI